MKTEFEIKILDINIQDTIAKLESLGAASKGTSMQKRYVYDFKPASYNQRVRLRTNGEKATLCIKEIMDESKIEGTKELEIVVSDFDTTHAILEKLGYMARAYQENRRTSYSLNGCDVEIDEWPLIPPYLEIEGPDEQKVQETLAMIGTDGKITTSENTTAVYKRYGIEDLEAIKYLAFKKEE